MSRLKMTEEKIRKMVLPSDPFYKSLNESKDWVDSLKVCLRFLSDSLRKFASEKVVENLADDFIVNTDYRIFDLSVNFQKFMRKYASILDAHYSPMTTQAKEKIRQETVDFWKDLESALSEAKDVARQIKGRAIMLKLWDDDSFKSQRIFLERLESSTLGDIRARMDAAEFPLGDDIVDYED